MPQADLFEGHSGRKDAVLRLQRHTLLRNGFVGFPVQDGQREIGPANPLVPEPDLHGGDSRTVGQVDIGLYVGIAHGNAVRCDERDRTDDAPVIGPVEGRLIGKGMLAETVRHGHDDPVGRAVTQQRRHVERHRGKSRPRVPPGFAPVDVADHIAVHGVETQPHPPAFPRRGNLRMPLVPRQSEIALRAVLDIPRMRHPDLTPPGHARLPCAPARAVGIGSEDPSPAVERNGVPLRPAGGENQHGDRCQYNIPQIFHIRVSLHNHTSGGQP